MTWTKITRKHYCRDGLRYASDLTDAEWDLLEPLMPAASALGRPRETDLRCVVEAILYIAATSCQWRALPKEFPPYSTVQGYFYAWAQDGTLASINHLLLMQAREAAGREASPSAGVIDSQSVQTTECGGPRGFDAGKKINGRKRHIVTDTQGNLVGVIVHRADIQDRDGAIFSLTSIRSLYPWLRHIFADAGYAGPKLRRALMSSGDWVIEIVKRSDKAVGFELLPRRWVVERTFAWLGRCRRLAKDFERTIQSAESWVSSLIFDCSHAASPNCNHKAKLFESGSKRKATMIASSSIERTVDLASFGRGGRSETASRFFHLATVF